MSGPESNNLTSPTPGTPALRLSFQDFLQAGFSFPVGTRLLVDACVLLGYLNASDPWHPITKWLFRHAILVPHAPRMFIIDRTQGEFGHVASKLLATNLTGGSREPTSSEYITCRHEALSRLESMMGPYPLLGYFPGSESGMSEWRALYKGFLFGETDALLLATCMVYSLDLLTVDHNLVRLAHTHQRDLSSRGYHFTVYYTPRAQAIVPTATHVATP